MRGDYYSPQQPSKVTEPDPYTLGYEHGKASFFYKPLPRWTTAENDLYKQGYDDGLGEYQIAHSVRPVEADYYVLNAPPYGYEWTGEKRVAQDGEYYLTKNGNAKKQVGTRRNNQTRHILRRV